MFGFSVVELKYDISCDQCKEKIYIVHDLKKKKCEVKKKLYDFTEEKNWKSSKYFILEFTINGTRIDWK